MTDTERASDAEVVRVITECEVEYAAMRQEDRAVVVVAALRAAGYEIVKVQEAEQ